MVLQSSVDWEQELVIMSLFGTDLVRWFAAFSSVLTGGILFFAQCAGARKESSWQWGNRTELWSSTSLWVLPWISKPFLRKLPPGWRVVWGVWCFFNWNVIYAHGSRVLSTQVNAGKSGVSLPSHPWSIFQGTFLLPSHSLPHFSGCSHR